MVKFRGGERSRAVYAVARVRDLMDHDRQFPPNFAKVELQNVHRVIDDLAERGADYRRWLAITRIDAPRA